MASPTTSMSSSASRIIRKPPRISAWSSAISTRMVTAARPVAGDREPRTDEEPAAGTRARSSSVAAEERHALAHPDQAVAARRRPPAAGPRRRRSTSSVDRLAAVAQQRRARGAVPAVLQRVRERLLDDAIGGQVDAGRQRPGVAFDDQLHRRVPSRASVPSSSSSRSNPGCGARVGVDLASDVRSRPHLGETGPTGLLDPLSARSASSGSSREHRPRARPPARPSRSCCARPRRGARARSGSARAPRRRVPPARARVRVAGAGSTRPARSRTARPP